MEDIDYAPLPMPILVLLKEKKDIVYVKLVLYGYLTSMFLVAFYQLYHLKNNEKTFPL